MKSRRYTILLWLVPIVFVMIISCNEDFLEKPDSSDVTIDTIFTTRVKAETFLWETYRTCVPIGFPFDWGAHHGMYASMLVGACDEGDVYDAWPGSNAHNLGGWGPSGNSEDDFGSHYKGIRNANIFMENIDRVTDISDQEKAEYRAEANVLRALQYAELLKRYGGIPIVDHVLSSSEDVKLPRNTYEECVDFIVKSCDDAAAVLPDSYSPQFRGRITKGAALALKARVLLYAASPLHNTDEPYSSENRALTGYISYSAARWQKAADAAKDVLDWAAGAGVILVKTDADPGKNYEIAVSQPDNSEIILGNKAEGWWGAWWPMFQQFAMPRGIYGGWYGHGVTLQHTMQYHTADGNDQVWPDEGPESEYLLKMQQLEPRFQRSVFYSGAVWNTEIGERKFYQKNDGSWFGSAPLNGTGYMKKFLTRLNWGGGQLNWPVFRLAEFYLNYAEALNEAVALAPDAFTALNEIRLRGGLPAVSSADSRYDTQQELREAIRRERAVELAFEEHRFFDVRRWMIAAQEGVMKGQMWELNLYEQPDNSILYRKEVFESRVWEDKMYLYPYPQSEMDKRYLIQNPGW